MYEERMDTLERMFERERESRVQAIKYAHNMMEDLQGKLVEFSISQARVETTLENHTRDDRETSKRIDLVFSKLDSITKLVWIGVGGVIVLAGLVSIVGHNILRLLGASWN